MSGKSALIPTAEKRKVFRRRVTNLLVATVFIFVAYSSLDHKSELQTTSRSSVLSDKYPHLTAVQNKQKSDLEKLDENPGKFLRMTTKLTNPITIQITNSSKASYEAGQPFTLLGVVTAAQAFDQLQVDWRVPAGVEVVSGAEKTTLLNLKAGEQRQVELTVVSDSSQNKQIHLTAEGKVGEMGLSNIAQYNTTDEEEIKAQKQKMFENNKALVKSKFKKKMLK